MDMSLPAAGSDQLLCTTQALLDALDVPACVADSGQTIIVTNSAASEFVAEARTPGLRFAVGRTWQDLCFAVHGDGFDRAEVAQVIDRVRRASSPVSVDYSIRVSGRAKSFRLTARPIPDGRGCVLVTQTDTTASRLAERRLFEAERRVADIAELSSDWLWATDDELRFVELASPSNAFWRRAQPAVIGRSVYEVFGAAAGLDTEPEATLIDMGRRRSFHGAIMTLEMDGRTHFVRVSGKPVFGAAGFQGYVGIAIDVTTARESEAARRVAERRIRLIAELSSDWFWETDAEHRFTYLSNGQDGREQLDVGRVLARRRIDLVDRATTDPADLARHLDDLENCRPFREFVYGCRQLGYLRYLKVSGNPRFGTDGDFLGYVGTTSDVTAVVKAEADRKAAERRLEAAVQQMPSGVAIWDRDDRLVVHNADYLGLAGIDPGRSIVGASFEDMVREFLAQNAISAVHDVEEHVRGRIAAHRNPGGPSEVALANGRILQLRERRLPDGSTVSIATDITMLKKREASLSQQRALLQTTLDHISDGILAVDEDWRITAVNDTFGNLLGMPKELARVGAYLSSVLEWLAARGDYGPATAQVEASRIVQSMADRARWYDERPIPNGRQIAWRARRMQGGGRIIAIADVSEQKEAEERREQLRATMAQAEKLEAVGQLAGGLAHDLNNALLPIVTLAEMALDDLPPESATRADMERVVAAAEHARGLVQRLLTFSRSGSKRNRFVLDRGVKSAIKLVEAGIGAATAIRTELRMEDVLVPLDETEIQQIVVNLGMNAAQAIGDRPGTITVATTLLDADDDRLRASPGRDSARRYAKLVVADDGPGIAPDVLPRIFEPFFTTKEVGKGTGLGLAVTHGLVRHVGGWIDVSSADGAQFDVFLPVVDTAGSLEGADGAYSSD